MFDDTRRASLAALERIVTELAPLTGTELDGTDNPQR